MLYLQAILPTIKFLKGECFTEEHWIEIFQILNMTPKPTEMLYLKDFLEVSETILGNERALQVKLHKLIIKNHVVTLYCRLFAKRLQAKSL